MARKRELPPLDNKTTHGEDTYTSNLLSSSPLIACIMYLVAVFFKSESDLWFTMALLYTTEKMVLIMIHLANCSLIVQLYLACFSLEDLTRCIGEPVTILLADVLPKSVTNSE